MAAEWTPSEMHGIEAIDRYHTQRKTDMLIKQIKESLPSFCLAAQDIESLKYAKGFLESRLCIAARRFGWLRVPLTGRSSGVRAYVSEKRYAQQQGHSTSPVFSPILQFRTESSSTPQMTT